MRGLIRHLEQGHSAVTLRPIHRDLLPRHRHFGQ